MADTSHLERMGRELKCPICLSLMNSAVSLTCNHMFCGSCIQKSMKSAANCPVCKIPFHRREIRPAPHMDNLVSIYKSMEVASGFNIFLTQNASSVKPPAQKDNGDKVCKLKVTDKSEKGKDEEQQYLKRCKKRGKSPKATIRTSVGIAEPSFPAKKRVHVPQYPPTETPEQCRKLSNEADDIVECEPEKRSSMQHDKVYLCEKRESALAPFFWLRDEDEAENVTQQTGATFFTGTPLEPPCFSDIKGSDDDVPCKTTPESAKPGSCIAPEDADYMDSEMFEWTQRPCSPELYTSPMKTEVALVEDSFDGEAQDKNGCAEDDESILRLGVDNREIMISEKEKENADLASSGSLLQRTDHNKSQKTDKRGGGRAEKRKKKLRKAATRITATLTRLNERGTKPIMQKVENSRNGPGTTSQSFKPNKEIHTNGKTSEILPENVLLLSGGIDPPIQGNNINAVGLSAISDPKRYREQSTVKSNDTTKVYSLKRRRHSRTDIPNVRADEHHLIQKESDVSTSHFTEKSPADEKQEFNEEILIRNPEDFSAKKKKGSRRVRFSKERAQDNLVDKPQLPGSNVKVAAKGTVVLEVTRSSSSNEDSSFKEAEAKLVQSFHSRSEATPNKVICAFCLSSEESEASGNMFHYLDGNPVEGDLAQGPSVVHSHKNCAEWAPNVFFEDDNAINLESELTRSRRLTCFLCGTKGAALGCYQKSCRKSFHVPCAMMTPECRWDSDNYVMLCPLHASCKLPCELQGSPTSQKRRSVPKRNFAIHKDLSQDDSKADSQWKSPKESKNLVLCCSGLLDTEKVVISQFERSSGVRILKSWDSSVTHVIASTNEVGACKRTLKVLMGILEGKWIVTLEWVKACLTSMELVKEQNYEIEVDTHGIRNGPRFGRLRILQKKPKLFRGLEFYFLGDFEASYKRYLHDLVIAGGGTVLHRKPISGDQKTVLSRSSASSTYIIYSLELSQKCEPSNISSTIDRRRSDAEALAVSTGSLATTNSWILNSIAGCKLQNLTT